MGSNMAQFIDQLQFQIKLFLKIVLSDSRKPSRRGSRKSPSVRRQRQSRKPSLLTSVWFWGLLLAAIMLLWNWELLLATLTGMGVLILLFRFPIDRWGMYWRQWETRVNASHKRLLLALAGSSFAGIAVYWGLNLWTQIENHWLAGGAIGQGVLITLLLCLQVSKLVTDSGETPTGDRFSQRIEELTAEHPLKRLLAIQDLTQLAIKGRLQSEQLKQISEYFSLLFKVETEPMIRQGLLESMQTLQLHHCWQNWNIKQRQPLQKLQKVHVDQSVEL